jgi:3-methyl-2-oxobutanoate hydroxymethyltransferase
MSRKKVTLAYIHEKKAKGEKCARSTIYDYPMALFAEEAGIEIINVGDSMTNVVLGYKNTLPAKMEVMVEHTKAVRRGSPSAYIMGDMPFLSYQVSTEEAIRNAGRFIIECDTDCVKVEGGFEVLPVIRALTAAGIPVVGHTGLTPQTSLLLGGYKTQGRTAGAAYNLVKTVEAIQEAGAVACLVETVPNEVGKAIYERVQIPIFGSGCGPYSDAPNMLLYDMLGFYEKIPTYATKYVDLKKIITEALVRYVDDCHTGKFPAPENSYNMLLGEAEQFQELLDKDNGIE